MELVEVTETHYEFIRNLRMHPKNLKWFLFKSEITAEEQVKYMEKHAQNYRVCLLYGEPVGYVGVIENDIRICTHPSFVGNGVGYFMLSEIKKLYPEATGKIFKHNIASRKLFEKCKIPYEVI
jgi:RimJ/RimL family protein N-acetyltransferase